MVRLSVVMLVELGGLTCECEPAPNLARVDAEAAHARVLAQHARVLARLADGLVLVDVMAEAMWRIEEIDPEMRQGAHDACQAVAGWAELVRKGGGS